MDLNVFSSSLLLKWNEVKPFDEFRWQMSLVEMLRTEAFDKPACAFLFGATGQQDYQSKKI